MPPAGLLAASALAAGLSVLAALTAASLALPLRISLSSATLLTLALSLLTLSLPLLALVLLPVAVQLAGLILLIAGLPTPIRLALPSLRIRASNARDLVAQTRQIVHGAIQFGLLGSLLGAPHRPRGLLHLLAQLV